jgi:hypothetical protein
MKLRHVSVVRIVAALLLAACGDSGTGVDAGSTLAGSFALQQVDGAPLPIALRRIVSVDPATGATSSCTESLTAMSIEVTSSGSATRSESRDLVCDGSNVVQGSLVLETGTTTKTGDGWRLDFGATSGSGTTRYFGQVNGVSLTIVRREAGTPPLMTVDLTQLVFKRL